MPNKKDLTGLKFNRMTVVKELPKRVRGMVMWECLCECGKKTISPSASLIGGYKKSCGCIGKEKAFKWGKSRKTHGMTGSREWNAWIDIKKRCYQKTYMYYKNYGGRGINMYDGWKNSFESFFKDIGLSPTKKHQIDRINNNKGYFPGNCKWSTPEEQANNRSTNRYVYYKGEKLTISQVCKKYNLKYGAFIARLNRGWSVKKSIEMKS